MEDHNDSPPLFLSPNATAFVSQAAERGQLIHVARASDADASDTLKFTLIDGNSHEAFFLDHATGEKNVETDDTPEED